MKYDNLISCSRCGSDACYTQEVNKDVSLEFCYGCGFQTNSLMKKGEEFFETQIETLPNLYKELMGEDETGKIWMPQMINIPNRGMVFANGPNADNWKWASVQAVKVKDEPAFSAILVAEVARVTTGVLSFSVIVIV